MKTLVLLIALMGTPQTASVNGVSVTRITKPRKELQFKVTVPAKVDDVWQAFTTSEGLKTWLWSDAVVTLKPGGDWIVNYPGGKTGGGTIVSFKPGKQITMRAMAPEAYPTVRKERTTAVFSFKALDASHTQVSLSQFGWKQGKEWDDAYEYLAKGNAQLLEQLKIRFEKGPIDWKKAPQ